MDTTAGNMRGSTNANQGFAGLRVVAFESRQSSETGRLIEKSGGVAISAPSLRELPLEANDAAFTFAAPPHRRRVRRGGVHDRRRHTLSLPSARDPRRASRPGRGARSYDCSRTRTQAGPRAARARGADHDRGAGAEHMARDPDRDGRSERGRRARRYAHRRTRVRRAERALRCRARRARRRRSRPCSVYRWALPENLAPLVAALRQIIARTVDVALFTSATQVRHVLEVARREGLESDLRGAFEEVLVASVGPVCTEALVESGLRPDFEPSQGKLGVLVRETAERALGLLEAKRRLRAPRARRVERAISATPSKPAPDLIAESAFMKACRREPTPYTPIWLMRQAGRYMQEYRELRARVPFIELCKTPELAAEAAVTAVERLGVDAAILFSDILLIIEPMGLGLEYVHGEGPSISRVVAGAEDVARLREVDPTESLPFVFEAVRRTRRELAADIPLIGFSGAPFTLASYIIEGGGSRNYVATKSLMYRDPGAWHAMMELIARAVVALSQRAGRSGLPSAPALRQLGRLPRARRLRALRAPAHAGGARGATEGRAGDSLRHRHRDAPRSSGQRRRCGAGRRPPHADRRGLPPISRARDPGKSRSRRAPRDAGLRAQRSQAHPRRGRRVGRGTSSISGTESCPAHR